MGPAPVLSAYVAAAGLACVACGVRQGVSAPSPPAALLALIGTQLGQAAVLNFALGVSLGTLRVAQWLIFGKLRIIEWQRLWERMLNYTMCELVILGAVVEPDLPELVLWVSFSCVIGICSLYAGLARDRLEYMAHLPVAPTRWAYARIVGLQLSLLALAAYLVCAGIALLAEAGLSILLLFMFQAMCLVAEVTHALVHSYLSRRERLHGASGTLYYAALVPEIAMKALQLGHIVHVWWVHGVTFSVVDVLLLANTKASYEALQRRVTTHRNFLRADANLQHRFRTATAAELDALDDCCAICR